MPSSNDTISISLSRDDGLAGAAALAARISAEIKAVGDALVLLMDEELAPPSPLCERDGDEGKEAGDAISIDQEMSSIAYRIISLSLMSSERIFAARGRRLQAEGGDPVVHVFLKRQFSTISKIED